MSGPVKLVCDLLHPASALRVVQAQYLGESPVHMASEEGCLLVDSVQGVACYPPSSGTSTSWLRPQCGHPTVMARGVSPLTRL